MASLPEYLLRGHNYYHGVSSIKAALKKDPDPIRLGVLGAAGINSCAIFDPADTHPSISVTAIAARSLTRAQDQIKKYSLRDVKPYGSYAELIQAPDIDAVYVPLPNGLHAEWTIKALQAGKHVLCEKPLCSNAAEARQIREEAERAGKVALEAFHWRFHPAAHRTREIIESGDYGKVQSVSTWWSLPRGFLAADDIRFNYELGGGTCMDLTYVFSAVTYFAGWDVDKSTFEVKRADARKREQDERIDDAMTVDLTIDTPGKGSVECHTYASICEPPAFGIVPKVWELNAKLTIELEKATIQFDGYPGPWLKHSIVIKEKDAQGKATGKKQQESAYVGGPQWASGGKPDVGERFWTTYRYQLEAFVDMIRAREAGSEYRGPQLRLEESEKLMSLIDAVYDKAGMPRRGAKE